MLTLDYLTLLCCMATVGFTTTAAIFRIYYASRHYRHAVIATTVFSYIALVATVVPIIRTHLLKKAGKLPAPGAAKPDPIRLGEQE